MAKTATAATRAPRGTKIVAEAFLTAVNQIPEPQRADVVKAALALIGERLKAARDKAKLAKGKQKANVAKEPLPSKAVARAKVATKKAVAPAQAKNPPVKAAVKRGKASQTKASEPASKPADEATKPNDSVTI